MRVNTRDAFKYNSNTLDRANRLNTILAKIADPSLDGEKALKTIVFLSKRFGEKCKIRLHTIAVLSINTLKSDILRKRKARL